MQRFDEDGNGKLDLGEFRSLVGELRRYEARGGRVAPAPAPATRTSGVTVGSADYWGHVEDIFRTFDKDGSGCLDLGEFLQMMGLSPEVLCALCNLAYAILGVQS